MKNKKLVSVLLIFFMLVLLLSMPAHAEAEDTAEVDVDAFLRSQYEKTAGMYAYDSVASRLYSIDVLLGDGVNFNLDQIPDRQQACVMVVRMRGEEAAALAAYETGEIACPFTDVTDEWVKPYLAWLYEKQIMLGVGEGKFGNSECSAQMYVTFMLRALGYTVAWDPNSGWSDVFYADVLDFARGIQLWDARLACEPAFNRGVMSAVTYQALAANVKGTEDRLLAVLAQSGAVDAEKAQPILDLYDKVDMAAALTQASIPETEGGLKAAGSMEYDEYQIGSVLGAPEGDRTTTAHTGMAFGVGFDFTKGKQELALNGEIKTQLSGLDMTVPVGIWLHDGMVYTDIMGRKQRMDIASAGENGDLTAAFADLSMLFADTDHPYYAVTDVYVEVSDEISSGITGTVIGYDTTDFMWPMALAYMEPAGFSTKPAVSVIISTEKYIDENGVLAGIYNGMYADITENDAQMAITYKQETLIENTIFYNAWGTEAELTFPDFSQFVIMSDDRSDESAAAHP